MYGYDLFAIARKSSEQHMFVYSPISHAKNFIMLQYCDFSSVHICNMNWFANYNFLKDKELSSVRKDFNPKFNLGGLLLLFQFNCVANPKVIGAQSYIWNKFI